MTPRIESLIKCATASCRQPRPMPPKESAVVKRIDWGARVRTDKPCPWCGGYEVDVRVGHRES